MKESTISSRIETAGSIPLSHESQPPIISASHSPISFFHPPICESSPIYALMDDMESQWIQRIKFVMDESFKDDRLPIENKINNQHLFTYEVATIKELLHSLPLPTASKIALSTSTIRLVPEQSNSTFAARGLVTPQKEFHLPMLFPALPEERRCTFMHEIHHLTVAYVNEPKIPETPQTFEEQQYVTYPFLDAQGHVDDTQKSQLKEAIEQFEKSIHELDSLLQTPHKTHRAIQKLNVYLKVLTEYRPQLYRMLLTEEAMLTKKETLRWVQHPDNPERWVASFTLPNGLTAYMHSAHYLQHAKKFILIYTFAEILQEGDGQWNTIEYAENLARAFVLDYREKRRQLDTIYPRDYAALGYPLSESQLYEEDYLVEQCGSMEELLTTPAIKKQMAPQFHQYFMDYFELDTHHVLQWCGYSAQELHATPSNRY